jgi:Uncharacterized conserved protein
MSKYTYPAIFTKEEDWYIIDFPDLESCYTQGNGLNDAISMAEDVLALTLYDYEKEGREIPVPSSMETIKVKQGEFVNYILCDTMEYRKMFNSKAVKKTLSIPEWLNEEAISEGVNFSQVLQEALKNVLGVAKV